MKLKNWQILLAVGGGAAAIAIALNSSATTPKGSNAVQLFDQEKYLGKCYEIAKLDFRFEKCLINVTATYSIRPDGLINVDNKGFNTKIGVWKESVGKAKFAGLTNEAELKYFGPFYAFYYVIAIDDDYQFAVVAGKNLDYRWILSGTPTIPTNIRTAYLKQAHGLGYDSQQLVWIKHDRHEN